MKKSTKQRFQKHCHDIYYHKSPRGWAIVIMPDKIRIDTYDKKTHIHFGLKGIHIPIKFDDLETVGLIIELHLDKHKKINKKKLKEILI
ncbi:MAG: hypothetical protein FWH54_06315 [Methanobrevibacter sp.]|nr:hypothetical protein [Methanobrevibacter sp.]